MGRNVMPLSGASMIALLLSSAAGAQTVAPQGATAPTSGTTDAGQAAPAPTSVSPENPATQTTPEDADNRDIVVTGSRITAAGYDAPTPTTTLSAEMIRRTAQPNVFNTLTQLPALQGSTGAANNSQNSNTSVGDNGLSALNMRGLGTIRTLTLLDGQRVVPAYINGVVDISQFPQLLIQQVDVVTGGASASYGSDAVAGVVNFVTEKHFKGIRGNVQSGISTYGDDSSVLAQLAIGSTAFDDRLHVQVSGEYFRNTGIVGGSVGGAPSGGRPVAYREGATSYSIAATPAGAPQNTFYLRDAQDITFGRFGLITAGPLQGTAFDANGNVTTFQYGGNGTPLRTGNPGVSGCIGAICQGGDQSNFVNSTRTIDDPLKRLVGYTRIGFDVTPDIEIYGTGSIASVKISNTPIAYPRRAGITIQCSNPLLPQSVSTACSANRITSFLFGTTNANFPRRAEIFTERLQTRLVGGADGSFNLLGERVKFDAYYTHGENRVDIDIDNMILLPRFNAAIQATRNAAGQIVCASAAAIAGGCVPINVFGGRPLTDAQYNYLAPANGPRVRTNFVQDAGSLAFNATPFSTWAGKVAVATGAEWRRERYVTRADPYGAGPGSASLNGADYPVDPLLSTNGSNWFAGNYKNGRGAYSVKEAFLELGVPLLDSEAAGKFDVNLAGRIADYSTSGTARTWKTGATWATPLDGLRLRGVLSRDIRAPNLSELFAAPQTQTQIVINRASGASVQILANTTGNTNLRPEVSNSKEFGIVYRPAFLPQLVFSIDYFDIRIKQAISAFTAQQIIDLCTNGNQDFCSAFNLTGTIGTGTAPFVNVQPFNLAQLQTRGIDFEAGYRLGLGSVGKLDLHALATHTIDYTVNPGISGQIIQQQAGNNTADTPRWKVNTSQAWTRGAVSFNLTERWVSAGKINPNYITCLTGCPAPTVQNPTTNFNRVPGALYVDVGAALKVNDAVEFYGRIDNVGNHRIPPFGSTTIYDTIGRVFRLGVRFNR
ncbi:TonB-dependent receptor plug domain-containing protein [Sphingomonas sp. CFBP 8760]|uniref:TonB-dependent receptor plug domain-containing protein n=1 Tax=Sphingomonas sp. CFBP 8760 TaxID=2775282 RepID=UPI001784B846|nr:TonB-dependent receptor [Sphingomonas sp. CFBP 8760]MBD8548566.1 TonB-dependent receptor [Sphingomonas sp. CFBP 8760]